ncbi:hypothetical protein OAS19_01605 [Altererythrobacter sp.]|nr:hypothetical protein [Altererythrobacter sp.]
MGCIGVTPVSVARPPQFDKSWRRKRRWRARWHTLRPWLAIGALAAVTAWFSSRPHTPGDGVLTQASLTICGERWSSACVIDGDTLAFGSRPDIRRVRLTGYDAPELEGACPAESAKARDARAAAHQWLTSAPFLLSGGDDPPYDQYGRELRAAFRIDQAGRAEFLADIMIERGLAEDNGWGGSSMDWCA